jgi:hypothetical protein
MSSKMHDINVLFKYFGSNNWIYQSEFVNRFVEVDRKNCGSGGVLDCNVKAIDWQRGVFAWIYGIKRYFLKQDLMAPEKHMTQLVTKNQI